MTHALSWEIATVVVPNTCGPVRQERATPDHAPGPGRRTLMPTAGRVVAELLDGPIVRFDVLTSTAP